MRVFHHSTESAQLQGVLHRTLTVVVGGFYTTRVSRIFATPLVSTLTSPRTTVSSLGQPPYDQRPDRLVYIQLVTTGTRSRRRGTC